MSLINQTNEEYYAGEKVFAVTAAPQTVFTCTFEPDMNASSPPKKNLSVRTFNPLWSPADLNLKKLDESCTNSKPTPPSA